MNLAMTGSNRLRGIRQGAAAALLALALSGCISLGGKAPKMLIGLTADQSPAAGALPSGPQADALVVLDPEAGRKLDVLRIPVQVDDARIAYLIDVTWVERPARLFRQLVAETIRSRGKRLLPETRSRHQHRRPPFDPFAANHQTGASWRRGRIPCRDDNQDDRATDW